MKISDLSYKGFESLSILSSENQMSNSSNTLGRPRPIEVLGRDLGLASNLLSVSEFPSPEIQNGFLRMEVTNSEE